jgi:hypothetical protein
MLCVKKEMVLGHVVACQIILEIHILIVDRNVYKTLIVLRTKHALTLNVLILVLELVGLMQTVVH